MTSQPIYLLSTGALSERLVKEAAEQGVVLDVMSLIAIEYMEGIAGMEKLTAQPLTVVFTSAHAVNAVAQWMHKKPEWRVYCIGGATFVAVVRLFGEKAVIGKAGSAAELAKLIRVREPGPKDKIIFFCGDQRRAELPSLGVTEMIVYRTVPAPHRIQRNYDGIAFFSPSAVESFFSVNVIAGEVPLFAIGPTTAAAIRARCTNPVTTGGAPDKAMLIHKMIDHFLNKR